MIEENDWQPKKHVENKCENGRYGASTTKLICYASPVFTSVYTSFTCLGLSIRPYLYSLWFIALVSLLAGGLIQLWNPTRISQSIVTKCHCPITILFHWAGLGLYNLFMICNHQSRSSSIVTMYHPKITILFHWAGLALYNKWYAMDMVCKIINHQSQSS